VRSHAESGFFHRRKHQSSIWRVAAESHYIAHLLIKLRIVGNLKLLHTMRLDVTILPDAPRHHAGNAHLAGEHAHAALLRVRQPGLSEWCPRSSAPTPGSTLAAIDSAFERGRKASTPPWANPLDETDRFAAQSHRWELLARPVGSPHIFGPGFAGCCRRASGTPTGASQVPKNHHVGRIPGGACQEL
jgi:hypothetical protein